MIVYRKDGKKSREKTKEMYRISEKLQNAEKNAEKREKGVRFSGIDRLYRPKNRKEPWKTAGEQAAVCGGLCAESEKFAQEETGTLADETHKNKCRNHVF